METKATPYQAGFSSVVLNPSPYDPLWPDLLGGVVHIILLVSSSRYKDRWIVPGGGIEPSEPPAIAAEREVFEEAGVRGKLGRLIGEFENNDKKHRTSVFAFIVTELLEEWEEKKNLGVDREKP
ncbi:diphosphoinositol polyphosphate phosphohydrolase 2 isoform X2 [Octopus vulgaris]|uniref:Diphosphoinositol polyphosphate phosphohydrolase 2 isoform X2 n=1 Tax=Octopus vulgaris TaxID=6645 RepID=A0AA36FJN1_OCTVU|nr:diphosphoinositol polyphosphate phosphohydrolase 2 isoform X2 [Octopus vulgaris]